jgi:hypothetical protein
MIEYIVIVLQKKKKILNIEAFLDKRSIFAVIYFLFSNNTDLVQIAYCDFISYSLHFIRKLFGHFKKKNYGHQ